MEFSLYLLSLSLDGVRVMVFMASVDKAFWTNEGIITSFANIHDSIFWMLIASSLKVAIKTLRYHLFLLSENILTIDHILLFFCDYMMSSHKLHELFVKFIIYLSDFMTFMTADTIIRCLFLSANFIECAK